MRGEVGGQVNGSGKLPEQSPSCSEMLLYQSTINIILLLGVRDPFTAETRQRTGHEDVSKKTVMIALPFSTRATNTNHKKQSIVYCCSTEMRVLL